MPLPSGGVTVKLHETANNLYAVVSGTVHAVIALAMIVGYARTSSLAQVAGLEAQESDLSLPGARRYSTSRCRRSPSASSLRRPSISAATVTFLP